MPDIVAWIHDLLVNLIGFSFQSSMSEVDLRILEKEKHYMLVDPTWNSTYYIACKFRSLFIRYVNGVVKEAVTQKKLTARPNVATYMDYCISRIQHAGMQLYSM